VKLAKNTTWGIVGLSNEEGGGGRVSIRNRKKDSTPQAALSEVKGQIKKEGTCDYCEGTGKHEAGDQVNEGDYRVRPWKGWASFLMKNKGAKIEKTAKRAAGGKKSCRL